MQRTFGTLEKEQHKRGYIQDVLHIFPLKHKAVFIEPYTAQTKHSLP